MIGYALILVVTVTMTACATWLLVRDLQKKETGAFFFSIRRTQHPVGYWLFILMWLAVLLFSLMITLMFANYSLLMLSDSCDEDGKCEVTVTVDPA